MSQAGDSKVFGYGTDFDGYCFALAETVENAGKMMNFLNDFVFRIRDGIGLQFFDKAFIALITKKIFR